MSSVGKLWRKLFSGKYHYLSDGQQYAEESFEVLQHVQTKKIYYKSYLFTRSNSGELFKVFIDYQINENFQTTEVKIQKIAGQWIAEESFNFDFKENILHYKMTTPDGANEESRSMLKKFCVQTPSALCTTIFAMSKKFDNAARSQMLLVSSPNLLTYEKPLKEVTIYISYESKDGQTFSINQTEFQYTRCEIYSTDVGELENEFPIVIQLSKKFALPYLIQFDRLHQARLVQLETTADVDNMTF